MTGSHRHGVLTGVFLASIALAGGLPALAEHHEGGGEPPIQMVSTNVQGKNIYVPGTIVMEAGQPRTLQVYNTTDTPHGFSIEEAGVAAILLPGQENRVEVKALSVGVYRIFCQLHPAHRSAQLLVVAGAD